MGVNTENTAVVQSVERSHRMRKIWNRQYHDNRGNHYDISLIYSIPIGEKVYLSMESVILSFLQLQYSFNQFGQNCLNREIIFYEISKIYFLEAIFNDISKIYFLEAIFNEIMLCIQWRQTSAHNMSTCNINMFTCDLFISTSKIIMLTCNFIMSTCKIIMLTCDYNCIVCQHFHLAC